MDITTNNGKRVEMATLAERIRKNFSRIKIRRVFVKVPKLKVRKRDAAKVQDKNSIPISSIIKILINNSIEELKKEAKDEKKPAEEKPYKVIKEEKPEAAGYGTVSKSYRTAAQKSYVDYGKLFSYLGRFRSRNAYEDFEAQAEGTNSFLDNSARTLVDSDTMQKGARYVRYFAGPGVEVNFSSLVPSAGMNSSEWEQFKLWMKLDPVMYRLKTSTS